MYQYDLAVFIGRFQPYHNAHHHVVLEALKISQRVLIIVGSCNQPRNLRNPFTFDERSSMIWNSVADSGLDADRVSIVPLEDTMYNDDLWIKNIQKAVANGYEASYGGWTGMAEQNGRIALVGFSKDNTSYYLKLFPQWKSVNIVHNAEEVLSSTYIRNQYFKNDGWLTKEGYKLLPENVDDFLSAFKFTDDFKDLKDEYQFIEKYKQQWSVAPYPPTFVTTDAVVIQSGHILLIKRKAHPGMGLWALPGGFLGQDEKILDGMIRELREETKIGVPDPVLRGSIVKSAVFDDPNRSMRGRTITHASLIHLKSELKLPKIKGSDDAEKAKWVPLVDIRQDNMYEDHYHIIQAMIGEI